MSRVIKKRIKLTLNQRAFILPIAPCRRAVLRESLTP